MTIEAQTPGRARSKRGHPKPYQRADGRWCVQADLGRRPDGSRWRLPAYGRSEPEALARYAEILAEHRETETVADRKTTLAAWCDSWLEKIHPRWDDAGRREGIKHSSWRSYEMHVRLNIAPAAIGYTVLGKLTSRMVEDWMDHLRERGLSPRSRELALTTLKQALKAAKAQGMLTRIASDGVKAPTQTDYEAAVFTLTQARAFLKAIKGNRAEALLLVSAFSGSRQGETLALGRTDVDWDSNTLYFHQTLDWIKDASGKSQPVIEENKNATSRRRVHMPPYVMKALRRHIDDVDARAAELGDRWTDYGLLFPNESGGGMRGKVADRFFKDVLAANDLPTLRWHDLRHSAASIMLALGLSLHDVQKTLGWSSLQMLSSRYGHLIPELAAEQMAKLEAALIEVEESAE